MTRIIRRPSSRRGAALIVSLVCVSIVAALALAMVRSTLLARANRQTAADRLQAAWLAEAGLERAAARLTANGEYSGETWTLPADALDGRAGKVQIEITEKDARRFARATATFPAEGTKRAMWVKELEITKASP